jgi:hypothetical protein
MILTHLFLFLSLSLSLTHSLFRQQAELFGLFQGTVQYNNMAMKPFVSDVCSSLEASVASGATALNAFSAAMPLWGYNASLPFEDQCVGKMLYSCTAVLRARLSARERRVFLFNCFSLVVFMSSLCIRNSNSFSVLQCSPWSPHL